MVSCPKGVRVLKLKRSSVLLIVVMGLLATSGIALAGHDDSHAEDTQFSFGYDETNHILSLNIGPNWEPYVCDFEKEGWLDVEYGDTDNDGVISIDTLKDGDDAWEFDARPLVDLPDGESVAEPASVPYGTEGVCGLRGVVVAGPNGQVNHGQFMKAVKSLFDIKGQGCIVRYLAQSDIGRTDDTRVRVADVGDPIVIEDGEVTFSKAFQADCERGKKNGNGEAESTRGGRPDSPGNSAKGHANKP
jgi:hypothetical protein